MRAERAASKGGAAFLKLLQATPEANAASHAHPPDLAGNGVPSNPRAGAAAQPSSLPAAAVPAPSQQNAVGYRAAVRDVDARVSPAGFVPPAIPPAGLPSEPEPPLRLHQAAYVPETSTPERQRNPAPPQPAAAEPVEQLLQRWSRPGASQSGSSAIQMSIPATATRQPPGMHPQQPAAPASQHPGKR